MSVCGISSSPTSTRTRAGKRYLILNGNGVFGCDCLTPGAVCVEAAELSKGALMGKHTGQNDGRRPVQEPEVELEFVCPICSRQCFMRDAAEGWCNNCHAFTRDCAVFSCDNTPAKVAGNIAVCLEHARELELT